MKIRLSQWRARRGGVAILTVAGISIVGFIAAAIIAETSLMSYRTNTALQLQERAHRSVQAGFDDLLLYYAKNRSARGSLPLITIDQVQVARSITEQGDQLIFSAETHEGYIASIVRRCNRVTSECVMQ